MKLTRLAALALPLAMMSDAVLAAEPAKPTTDAQKAAYAIGYHFGSSLGRDAPDIDADAVGRGLADALKKRQPALNDEQRAAAITSFQQTLAAQQTKRMEAAATRNTEAAKKFLADNGKKPGVVTLPSGLQYQVMSSGKGVSPKKTDRVKVHYHGTLINGTVFDSSVQRGQPATFGVDQVIPGWVEGLQKMKVGDKWKLFIPPELAYGPRGAGGVIEPNSALIFDVELLEILPAGK